MAVADDPTATHWNPGGLIKGSPAGLTIGSDSFHFRKADDRAVAGSGRLSSRMLHIGTWPLGVSFGRIEGRGIVATSVKGLQAQALSINQIGVTVLQTLVNSDVGPHEFSVVVGSTLKYLRGTARIAEVSEGQSVETALANLANASANAQNAFDLDVGVIAELGRLRGGVTLKNLRRPTFAHVAGNAIPLSRRARLGLSVSPIDGLTLALDVDLDTADPLVGLRQVIALGGETRLGSRLALRGGIRWPRESGRPIGAFGGSLRVRQSLWIDGYGAAGSRSDQGFGIALRAGLN